MSELVPWPGTGRRFVHRTRVGIADAAPDGRARFDAIARWLQDAAHADLSDSRLSGTSAWVVRRTTVRVERFPRFEEPLCVSTFASGTGRMWAERRTTIEGEGGGLVEAAALWIHLDPATGRPLPLPAGFDRIYAPSTVGRKIKARLRHPEPPDGALRSSWRFRRVDLDVADHVNNAAYWPILEELVPAPPEPVTAEVEFRTPAGAGEATLLAADAAWWVVGAEGEVHASLTLSA
jgi:acyl-ACP thioesterase